MAIEIEKIVIRKKSHPNTTYNRSPRTYTPRANTVTSAPKKEVSNPTQKDSGVRQNIPLKDFKDIVCFKCNGRGHYKKDCPNARFFTMWEWEEIRQDTRPKVILVSKNGKEEEIWPSTAQNDPDGTYTVGDDGSLQQYEQRDSELEEEDLEQVMPENEQYNFIFRRSFHNTPRTKKSV